MGFERYERSSDRRHDEPLISIRASGSIGLNNAAVTTHFADCEWVELYYDDADRRVGIKPVECETSHAYSIQHGDAPSHGASIFAAGFLRDHQLLPEDTTRYPPTWDEQAGLLAIDLDTPAPEPDPARPAPTEVHATVDWFDGVSGAANLAVLADGGVEAHPACTTLLGTETPASTGVLVITSDRTADEWLAAYDAHADTRPAAVHIVDLSPADEGGTVERSDGVTVTAVSPAKNMTSIGIPVARVLSEFEERGLDSIRLCFDTLSAAVSEHGSGPVTEFLGVLTDQIRDVGTTSTDIRAHYHVDERRHDAETVDAIEAQVDATVSLDESGSVTGTRRH